jgi:transcriptional regulator with XRE-family HTH domain
MARNTQTANLVFAMREACGLSQRALAKRARTTQAVVARIELGLVSPTMETMRRLARAAGFDIEATLVPVPELDRQLLDDVPRILALSPSDRLREVANLSRFTVAARRG